MQILNHSLFTTAGIAELVTKGASFRFVLMPWQSGRHSHNWIFVGRLPDGFLHVLVTHATIRPKVFKSADTAIELLERYFPEVETLKMPLRPDPEFPYTM